jgi:hypothetical protein
MLRRRRAMAGSAALILALLPGSSPAAPAPVSIEAVAVSPSKPGPGALCGLRVTLKNAGTHTATDFRFKVKVNGEEVSVYGGETFAEGIAPGASETITIHSFWTPTAAKSSLTIEVSVIAGRWADVKSEGATTTTTPIGPIEGLPVSATQMVPLSPK